MLVLFYSEINKGENNYEWENKNFVDITVLMLIRSGQLFGQNKVGTTSFQFLKVEPGTRAAALGQSTVSIIEGAEVAFFESCRYC